MLFCILFSFVCYQVTVVTLVSSRSREKPAPKAWRRRLSSRFLSRRLQYWGACKSDSVDGKELHSSLTQAKLSWFANWVGWMCVIAVKQRLTYLDYNQRAWIGRILTCHGGLCKTPTLSRVNVRLFWKQAFKACVPINLTFVDVTLLVEKTNCKRI